jgi:ATP/maltotriose-dependent transcriptional regulator MalT
VELWERSEALGLLETLLRASTESGRVALVAAEAGMGKSTLVADFARGRRRVLWVRATSSSPRGRWARCTISPG